MGSQKKHYNNLLSRGWWTGLGVIIAIILGLLPFLSNLLPKPTGQFENDIMLHAQEKQITVLEGQEVILKPTHAKLTLSKLTIEKNGILVLPPEVKIVSISTINLELSDGASIVTSAKAGGSGSHGKDGVIGKKCANGSNGKDGTPGFNGKPSPNFELNVVNLVIDGQVKVSLNGGNGGNGGKGGNAGQGGTGSRGDSCGGGNGGRGGDGGKGGNGGDSGNISIKFVRAYNKNNVVLGSAALTSKINISSKNGLGGKGGKAGNRGLAGKGRGSSFPVSGQPAGSVGAHGNIGINGKAGNSGSLEIALQK